MVSLLEIVAGIALIAFLISVLISGGSRRVAGDSSHYSGTMSTAALLGLAAAIIATAILSVHAGAVPCPRSLGVFVTEVVCPK